MRARRRRDRRAARGGAMSARLLIRRRRPRRHHSGRGPLRSSRYGVTPAGPMDLGAFARRRAPPAPRRRSRSRSAASTLRAEGATLCVAVAGGAFDIRLDGRPMPPALPAAACRGRTARAARGRVRGLVLCRRRRTARSRADARFARHACPLAALGPKPLAAGDALTLAEAAAAAARRRWPWRRLG